MTTDDALRNDGSRWYPVHPFLCGPGLSMEEFETLFPGTIERQRKLDRLVYEVRAFGSFFVRRDALPEDLR